MASTHTSIEEIDLGVRVALTADEAAKGFEIKEPERESLIRLITAYTAGLAVQVGSYVTPDEADEAAWGVASRLAPDEAVMWGHQAIREFTHSNAEMFDLDASNV